MRYKPPGSRTPWPWGELLKIAALILPILLSSGVNGCRPADRDIRGVWLALTDSITERYAARHNHFRSHAEAWGNYTKDLVFEGMLAIDRSLGEEHYLPRVLEVMKTRGLEPGSVVPYHSQPFGCITFELWRSTADTAYIAPFVGESLAWYQEITRSPEGAICLTQDEPGRYLLIDYLQEYASRMAKLGYFTKDEKYFEECVSQFEIYRSLLRNPVTGLYSQGRGWHDDPMELSPGAWSRGHGWLLRGMVRSLEYLPPGSRYYHRLLAILNELSMDLLAVQHGKGMWHQLLHLPFEDSYPESSGTAFIVGYMAQAISKGYLPEQPFMESVQKGLASLKKYIGDNGAIYGACKGPGPLITIEPWYRTPAEPDDEHGFGTMLFAIAGKFLMVDNFVGP